MRLKDAIGSLQLGRKKDIVQNKLSTRWSEEAADGPDAVPLPEYPRPQLVRESYTCLNGWWEYAFRPAGQAMGEADGKILVPFSPESDRSGVSRTLMPGETLWYKRELGDVPHEAGWRVILHFGAVDERCKVYVNGRLAGKHRNGYLPFSFDITDFLEDEENEIRVAVWDDTDQGMACRGKQTLNPGGMYYHAQSGIWQTVWVENVPENYITEVRLTPNPGSSLVELELKMAKKYKARVSVLLEDQEYEYAWNPGSCFKIPVENLHLWSPADPYLYPVKIRAGEDEISTYFAMRTFGMGVNDRGDPCLTLNEAPYFFHGVLDQGYWPESLMTAPADEAFVFDISEMKKAGFNMIRKHAKIEAARWYYHCDRLGMVVWQDMPNGGGPVNKLLMTYLPTAFPWLGNHLKDNYYRLFSRSGVSDRERFEEDLIAMVETLGNCPCIGLWVPFNEGWGQFDALRLCELVRKADPTRPVDHASGWFDQGGGDVRSVHNYFRPLRVEHEERDGKEAGNRAFVLSEYGGINCNVPDHSMSDAVYGYSRSDPLKFPEDFRQLMEKVQALVPEGLAGAAYTQVSDIEEETNGILTYDRKVVKLR